VTISAIKMMQRNLAAQPSACASRVSVAAELAATSAADNPGRAQPIRSRLLAEARAARSKRHMITTAIRKAATHSFAGRASFESANWAV
jgi:hypothetical protein